MNKYRKKDIVTMNSKDLLRLQRLTKRYTKEKQQKLQRITNSSDALHRVITVERGTVNKLRFKYGE